MTGKTDLPKLASPAQRALAGAGITCLEDLVKFRETDIAHLHGIGPNALESLRTAMKENNLKFAAG